MKMQKVIDAVSKEYRLRLNELSLLRKQHALTVRLITEAKRQNGENIILAEYNRLERDLKFLEHEIFKREQFLEGFSCAREVLMDLGFDTEVEA